MARDFEVTGTLGILDDAASLGIVDLAKAVERLVQTNFRVSPKLLKQLLGKHYSI
ncbi:DUF3368 domain-containing protein [Candidatus Babeliales bacterium]|nr:DUF3368 domain-containing protein [Candidatus Babeliales bacterium]